MRVKAEIEFEVPDDLPEELIEDWGISLASYPHEGIGIAFNRKDVDCPLQPCKVVGISVLNSQSGTLYKGED